jgi:hypothetical protein
MSLSCLTCSQVLQRTDSFRELFKENEYRERSKKVDRTWSGNMPSPNKETTKGGPLAKIKANHRRNHSTGNISYSGRAEPKLVRSSGMRRDWSFENLVEEDQMLTCHWDDRSMIIIVILVSLNCVYFGYGGN